MDENQKIAVPDLAPQFLSILTVPLHQTHASTQMPQVATVFKNYETNFFLSYPVTFIYLTPPVFSAFTSFCGHQHINEKAWRSTPLCESLFLFPCLFKILPFMKIFALALSRNSLWEHMIMPDRQRTGESISLTNRHQTHTRKHREMVIGFQQVHKFTIQMHKLIKIHVTRQW